MGEHFEGEGAPVGAAGVDRALGQTRGISAHWLHPATRHLRPGSRPPTRGGSSAADSPTLSAPALTGRGQRASSTCGSPADGERVNTSSAAPCGVPKAATVVSRSDPTTSAVHRHHLVGHPVVEGGHHPASGWSTKPWLRPADTWASDLQALLHGKIRHRRPIGRCWGTGHPASCPA